MDYVQAYVSPTMELYKKDAEHDTSQWLDFLKHVVETQNLSISINYDEILESYPPMLQAEVLRSAISEVAKVLRDHDFILELGDGN